MTGDPRSQSKRERFRQAVLAEWGPICWLCHRPIDLALKAPHPGSYTADHVIELARIVAAGGDPFDPTNGRPAHWRCNTSRGASFGNRRRRAVARLGQRTGLTW